MSLSKNENSTYVSFYIIQAFFFLIRKRLIIIETGNWNEKTYDGLGWGSRLKEKKSNGFCFRKESTSALKKV